MKQDEFLKIMGILFVSLFIIYMFFKMSQLQPIPNVIEGMTNNAGSTGEAGTSASYAASVKAQVVKLQDELLVSKYRKDYEASIINLDDYVGYLMLKQVLNMKMTDDIKSNIESLNNLAILKNSKEALNVTMTFLDKQ